MRLIPIAATVLMSLQVRAAEAPASPIPWGEPGHTVKGGQSVPIRARISLKAAPNESLPVVALGKGCEITYEVLNEGKADVVVWHAAFWPNHTIEVHTAAGREVPLTKWGAQVRSAFSPQGPRDKNVEWPLHPGKVDASEGSYDLTKLFDLSEPGSYRLQVKYQEDISFESNVLSFYVLPTHAVALLDRLNGWDRDECDVIERPQAHPGFVAAGESNGFVSDCKDRLHKAGVEVAWNPELKRYFVTNSALAPDRSILPASAQRCEKSEACALFQAECCPCSAGGFNSAVNAKSLKTVQGLLGERCPKAKCPAVLSPHASCLAKKAACVEGWCVPER